MTGNITSQITQHLEKQQENQDLRLIVACAIKTGKISFKETADGTVTIAAGHEFTVPDCRMEKAWATNVRVEILNSPAYRSLIETKITELLTKQTLGADTTTEIIKAITDAYIKPDGSLHLCVGFYENGDFKTNTVTGENLPDNIEYNRFMRPGRYYYVDGEYICGGMVIKEKMPERIATHKARIAELGLKPENHDTTPYI